MEILYYNDDNILIYRLVYIVTRRLTYYGKDKTYPLITQCLLYKNNLLVGFGEVVKCQCDENNQALAYVLATKKVLKNIPFRCVRKDIWKIVHERVGRIK